MNNDAVVGNEQSGDGLPAGEKPRHKRKADARGRTFPVNGWAKFHRAAAHAVLQLGGSATQVYVCLQARVRSDTLECEIPIETIIADTGLCQTAVYSAIDKLKQARLVTITSQSKGGRSKACTYRLPAAVENGSQQDQKPCAQTEGLDTDKPSVQTETPSQKTAQNPARRRRP